MVKFILTGLPRSGTTVISVSLSKHPEILFYGELLNNEVMVRNNESARITMGAGWRINNRPDQPLRPCTLHESGYQYLDKFFSRMQQQVNALGFKLLYDQALNGPNSDAWRYIEEHNEVKIIRTRRENLLEIICSYVRANVTRRWHVSNEPTKDHRFIVPPHECEILFKRFSNRPKELGNIEKTHAVIDVDYEEIETDFPDVMTRLYSFLQVDNKIEAKPELRKIARLRPNQELANYDQLRNHFRSSEYARYFIF